MLILKFEKGRVPRKGAGGSTLVNHQPRAVHCTEWVLVGIVIAFLIDSLHDRFEGN